MRSWSVRSAMPALCCELWTSVGQGSPELGPPHPAESPEFQECGLACSGPAGATHTQCRAHACTHLPELGPVAGCELAGAEVVLATRGQCSPRWAWVDLVQCVRVRRRGTRVEARPIFPSVPTSSAPPERGNGSLQAKPVPITPCSQHFWAVHANFENLPESSRAEVCWDGPGTGWSGASLLPEHLKELLMAGPSPRDREAHTPSPRSWEPERNPSAIFRGSATSTGKPSSFNSTSRRVFRAAQYLECAL